MAMAAKPNTNKLTNKVRMVRPSSPVIPTKPILAMTDVNPAKIIEIKAKTTHFSMGLLLLEVINHGTDCQLQENEAPEIQAKQDDFDLLGLLGCFVLED
jgi:hypothetical protein